MATTNEKPPIIQVFDISKVVEYYKIVKGLIFTHNHLVRADTVENRIEWQIQCKEQPKKVLINGEEYKLILQNRYETLEVSIENRVFTDLSEMIKRQLSERDALVFMGIIDHYRMMKLPAHKEALDEPLKSFKPYTRK